MSKLNTHNEEMIESSTPLLKLNLIREALLPTEDAEPIYEVVDPRILHLISRGTTEIE